MEKINSLKSIAYILGGSLLYQFNGVSDGWTAGLAAIFGFIIFIIGLDKFKSGVDQTGQSGAKFMRIGAILGGISSLIRLIPFIGLLAGIGFIVAFVLILIGLLQVRNSVSIGFAGKDGATRIIIGMILSIIAAMLSIMPFVGSIAASIFALGALILSFTGWIKIQDGLMEGREEMARKESSKIKIPSSM